MQITPISTRSIADAPRAAVAQAQQDLANIQQEIATGRYADVGLTLGSGVGETLLARQQLTDLTGLKLSTQLVASRIEVSQSAMNSMVSDANGLVSGLVTARANQSAQQTAVDQASGFLENFRSLSNTTYNGAHVFAGLNTSAPPMADYFSQPQAPARIAVQSAFTSYFGFASTDPKVSTITPQSMSGFLNGSFNDLFSGSSWSAMSSASSTNLRDRISNGEVVESSTNVNDPAFRGLAKAYVMLSDLGAGQLSQATFSTIADNATSALSSAVQSVGTIQSNLGFVQERITTTEQSNTAAADMLQKQISSLESADPYKASQDLTAITTALEASYSITSRIQKLSIMNYI